MGLAGESRSRTRRCLEPHPFQMFAKPRNAGTDQRKGQRSGSVHEENRAMGIDERSEVSRNENLQSHRIDGGGETGPKANDKPGEQNWRQKKKIERLIAGRGGKPCP